MINEKWKKIRMTTEKRNKMRNELTKKRDFN